MKNKLERDNRRRCWNTQAQNSKQQAKITRVLWEWKDQRNKKTKQNIAWSFTWHKQR